MATRVMNVTLKTTPHSTGHIARHMSVRVSTCGCQDGINMDGLRPHKLLKAMAEHHDVRVNIRERLMRLGLTDPGYFTMTHTDQDSSMVIDGHLNCEVSKAQDMADAWAEDVFSYLRKMMWIVAEAKIARELMNQCGLTEPS